MEWAVVFVAKCDISRAQEATEIFHGVQANQGAKFDEKKAGRIPAF
jgi:hypothetical protein